MSVCSVLFNPVERIRVPYGLNNSVSVFDVSGEVFHPRIEDVL